MFDQKKLLREILKHLGRSLVAVALVLMLVSYFKVRIQKITTSVSKQKSLAFVLERRSETIRQLQNDFSLVGNNEAGILKAWPYADNVVDFKIALESIANRQSLQSTVEFGMPAEDQRSIDFNISLNGNSVTLQKYLDDLEKLPYFASVNSIDIRPEAGAGWDGNSLITMKGKIFTKPVAD